MKIYSLFMVFLFFGTLSIQAPPDTLWTRFFGGTQPGCGENSGNAGRSVESTSDGGFLVAGWTYSTANSGADIWLIRTDELGDTLWTSNFGDSIDNFAYSIQRTADHGFIIAGFSSELCGSG